ncbi:hypothetical protein PIB30_087886 [Stylosanthes scabra]|uniref:Uncharacterized protein n=1 Tax=Stylosanthes scabra TaxID=79078 RepID=A0ABU6XVX2_9FABA|nr:hypothetical protein [Stylosanthes scabra]
MFSLSKALLKPSEDSLHNSMPLELSFLKTPPHNRRGRNKLRVAANGASIGALDQKLSRSEVADE